ncbi:MAG: SPOR domain-containing protein, partial [Deltaproteobacteria bacterium]|nr:SPOR domain-containing protein [Deltaproteobacteria bacterium]
GLSTYWVPVEFREKGEWYRLYSGHFEDQEHANQFIKENDLKEATVKNTRYGILLGVFSGQGDMADKMEELKNLDYSPYVIPHGENEFRLFVGAYVGKKAAAKPHNALKDQGFQSQVIER